jgi:hypothetical protein
VIFSSDEEIRKQLKLSPKVIDVMNQWVMTIYLSEQNNKPWRTYTVLTECMDPFGRFKEITLRWRTSPQWWHMVAETRTSRKIHIPWAVIPKTRKPRLMLAIPHHA